MCREDCGSNSAYWFNAIIITNAVSSIENDDKRSITRVDNYIHFMVAFVHVNSRVDSTLDTVLEIYGLVMERRAYPEMSSLFGLSAVSVQCWY